MSKENPFAIAEGKRIDITEQQAKQIRDMYKQIEKDFGERIRILSNKSNISSIMREQYLKDFTKDLQDRITILNYQLEGTITNNALEVAKAVTEDNEKMLREMGFGGVFTSNFHIPQDAVNSIVTGKLYEGKWTLSRAIWSDNQKKINDINSIVAKGLAENKSTYELAKDLERYVNPAARKEWDWSKVYPGTSKKIDYNAQRLARTMISHAYQESFVLNTKDNPFIEAYQWEASNSDRTCETCAERDGRIYAKDELPLDHPNGMCTFIIVREKSYEEIATDLSNWVKGTGDSELNAKLDKYADTLGYNVKAWTANTPQVQNAQMQMSNIKVENAKDLSEKWGVPVNGIQNECIKNFDDALMFMTDEFGISANELITVIDNKNPDYARNYAAYFDYLGNGIHVHKNYAGKIGINSHELTPETCAHEVMHAINEKIRSFEQKASNANGKTYTKSSNDVANEIIRKIYSQNGYTIDSKTNLPSKNVISNTLTDYASTNSSEAVAESAKLVFLRDYKGSNTVADKKYDMAKQVFEETKRRLNDCRK